MIPLCLLPRWKSLVSKKAGWITIGGSGEAGDRHEGTHVYLDDKGEIVAGPRSLVGRPINNLPKRGGSSNKPSGQPTHKPPENKLPKSPDGGSSGTHGQDFDLMGRGQTAPKHPQESPNSFGNLPKVNENWKKPNLDDEYEEISRAAEDTGLSRNDVSQAVEDGQLVELPEDAHDALLKPPPPGMEDQMDFKRIMRGMDEGKKLPAAIVLKLPDGSYRRVAGGHRLAASAARGEVPLVWLADMSGSQSLQDDLDDYGGNSDATADNQNRKYSPRVILKASCKPGQTAATTGCTPASGEGGKKPNAATEPPQKVENNSATVTPTPATPKQIVQQLQESLHQTGVVKCQTVDTSSWKPKPLTVAVSKKIHQMEQLAASGKWAQLEQLKPNWTSDPKTWLPPNKALAQAWQNLIQQKTQQQLQHPPNITEMQQTGKASSPVQGVKDHIATLPIPTLNPNTLLGLGILKQQLKEPVVNSQHLTETLAKVKDLSMVEPSWKLPAGVNPNSVKYGGVIFNDKGQVLLREPTNHYDGYHWTFPKGGVEPGSNPVDTANKEVNEETGYHGDIVGFIPGIHESGLSKNCYFAMKAGEHDPSMMDKETSDTKWVSFDEAEKLINQTVNDKGKQRDLAVLAAAKKAWEEGLKDKQVEKPTAGQPGSPSLAGKPCPPGVSAAQTGCIPQGQGQSVQFEGDDVPAKVVAYAANNIGQPAYLSDLVDATGWTEKKVLKLVEQLVDSGHLTDTGTEYVWTGKPLIDGLAPGVQLPKKPKVSSQNSPKSAQAIDQLEKLAQAGDLAGIQNLDVAGANGFAQKYKLSLMQALQGQAQQAPSSSSPTAQPQGSAPAKPPVGPVNKLPTGKPNTAGWKQTGGQKGSNPGGKFQAQDGKEYYVKFSKTPDHAKNEVLAAKLYELAGGGVPDYQLADTPQGLGTASAWMEHGDSFDPKNPQHKEAAIADFALHAWLANWDAVGQSADNQTWVKVPGGGQKLVTIDTGGSLGFKATGGSKPFGDDVPELVTMIDPITNPQAAKVFGSMTPQQLLSSYAKVTSLTPDAIEQMVDQLGPGDDASKAKLKATLLKRQAYIKGQADALAAMLGQGPSLAGKPCPPGVTNAATGCIPVGKGTGQAAQPQPTPVAQIPAKVDWNQFDKPGYSASINMKEEDKLEAMALAGDAAGLSSYKAPPNSADYGLNNYAAKLAEAVKTGKIKPQPAPAKASPVMGLPAKPYFWNTPTYSKKATEMEEAAKAGNLAKLQAVKVPNAKKMGWKLQKLHDYKKACIAALQSGYKPPSGPVNNLPTSTPPPSSATPAVGHPKIKASDLPSKPYTSNAGKQADFDALEKMALAGDLLGLQTFTPTTVSSKTVPYQNSLVSTVQQMLNPPPPPKPYSGQLESLTKAFKGAAAGVGASKVSYYLEVDTPGIPSDTWGKVDIEYTGSSVLTLKDTALQKAQDDAWDKIATNVGNGEPNGYTDGTYGRLNAAMVLGGPGSIPNLGTATQKNYDTAKKLAENIMEHAPELPVGAMLHRGVSMTDAQANELMNLGPGKVLQSTSFGSTRLTPQGYQDYAKVQFHYQCGPGVKALWAGTKGDNKSEREMILPPGYRFLIREVNKKGDQYHVDAILLPQVADQCC